MTAPITATRAMVSACIACATHAGPHLCTAYTVPVVARQSITATRTGAAR